MTGEPLALFPAGLRRVVITVAGTPVTQGSKTAIPVMRAGGVPVLGPGGRPVINMADDNGKKLKPWRAEVVKAGDLAMRRAGLVAFEGPCGLSASFLFTRPKGHYRTGRFADLLREDAPVWPVAKGKDDLDKLLRAVCDALTIAGVWGDDSQVAEFGQVRKGWALHGGQPGAVIRVWELA